MNTILLLPPSVTALVLVLALWIFVKFCRESLRLYNNVRDELSRSNWPPSSAAVEIERLRLATQAVHDFCAGGSES